MNNPISPKVYRSIYFFSVKNFVEKQGLNANQLINNFEIKHDKMRYFVLLDRLINSNQIDEDEVDKFLTNEVSFGRMKNISIFEITNFDNNLSKIEYVNSLLLNMKCTNSEEVVQGEFSANLRQGIEYQKDVLLKSELILDEKGYIETIKLILGTCIKNNEGDDCNFYVPIDIFVKKRLVSIRMKNWEPSAKDFKLFDQIKKYKKFLEDNLNIKLYMPMDKTQSIITKILRDLTESVLLPTKTSVNSLLKSQVEDTVKTWAEKALSPHHRNLTRQDYFNVQEYILNYFYSMHFKLNNDLDTKTILSLHDIPGYPTYVKFTDDTISEARTKSQTNEQTLLLTSIYYDLKARLDTATQIKIATIYWVDMHKNKNIGVSYIGEAEGLFIIKVKYNFFDEVIYDYILQNIRKYHK